MYCFGGRQAFFSSWVNMQKVDSEAPPDVLEWLDAGV